MKIFKPSNWDLENCNNSKKGEAQVRKRNFPSLLTYKVTLSSVALLFFISLMYSNLAISAQQGPVLDRQAFIDLFVDVALGRGASSDQLFPNEPRIILKWATPLNLRILKTSNVNTENAWPKVRRSMRRFLEIAADLNISTEVVDGNSWNYLFYFFDGRSGLDELVNVLNSEGWQDRYSGVAELLSKRMNDPTIQAKEICIFKLLYSREKRTLGEIRDAVVILPVGVSEKNFSSCFFEQTAQALGLPNDVDKQRYGVETLFDRQLEGEKLSETDLELLKTLYNPRITPGMNEQEVRSMLLKLFSPQ